MIMKSYFVVICALSSLPFLLCNPAETKFIRLRSDVIYTVDGGADNRSSCPDSESRRWSYDFHDCFIGRKYADGGMDLDNIVDRILDHASDCISNSSQPCRPDYRGFLVVMSKVIEQMKDYCQLYLEDIYRGREKIRDLDCVETSISNETYTNCFKTVFEDNLSEELFKKNVERAITCTNKLNSLCSRAAKTSLNRMARTILKVKQPDEEIFEDEVKPTPPPPPKRWYHYIMQPFISAWNWVMSWFG